MKSGFWKTDWFFGLVVALAILLLGNSGLLQTLERKAYDLGVASTPRTPSDKIAVIAIDEASLANLGEWPWPRAIHAKIAETLAGANAKVIATTTLFSEQQNDAGLQYITKLLAMAGGAAEGPSSSPQPGAAPNVETAASPSLPQGELGAFVTLLREADNALNSDRRTSEALSKAKNVVLPMLFSFGEPRAKQEKQLPEYVTKNALVGAQPGPDVQPLKTSAVRIPVE